MEAGIPGAQAGLLWLDKGVDAIRQWPERECRNVGV